MTRQFFLPLPTDLEPEETVCITFEIPKNDLWLASFWGYVRGLSMWFTWERDNDHTGKIMAAKYQEIIDNARTTMGRACELLEDVRQNEDTPCILEKKIDGESWEPFADLSLCLADGGTVLKAAIPKTWRFVSGKTQVSLDGGTTFYDFPDGEAAQYGQITPTYSSGVDKACVAAYNLVGVLKGQVAEWQEGLAVANAFLKLIGVITALLLALGTGGVAAPAAIAFVTTLVTAGSAGITAAFTNSFYDDLLCDIYSTIGSDGVYSSSELAALILTMQAHSGPAWTITSSLFGLIGIVGVNNSLNAAGITTCSSAPCLSVSVTASDFGTVNMTTAVVGDIVRMDMGYHPAYWFNYVGTVKFSRPIVANVIWHNATATGSPVATVWDGNNIPQNYSTYFVPTSWFRGIGGNSGTAGYITIEITAIS